MSGTLRTVLMAVFGWLVIGGAIWLATLVAGHDDGHVRWTAIDVTDRSRSGDAHLLEFPDGAVWMIDGGNKDLWQRSGAPLLKERGIERVDGFILTHGHRNHFEGLLELVLSGIEVGVVYYMPPTDEVCDTEPWPGGCRVEHLRRLELELKKAGVPVVQPQPGEVVFDDDDVRLTVLHQFNRNPFFATTGATDFTVNNVSIVSLLEAGDVSVLFPGDIGTIVGRWLTKNIPGPEVDIVVAPHHGVAQLAPRTWIESVNPKAIVATMPGPLWPTPRARMIRKFAAERSLPVYVSGLHGDVEFQIDGESYTVSVAKSPASNDPARPGL